MRDLFIRFAARPFVRLWIARSPHSWRRHVVAHDSPHLHSPGTNPDRVLIMGDGAATGRGVLTHDLGLPGFLARSLTERTGRATDVDIVVDQDMTVADCLAALPTTDLAEYDVVLLSVGANEALEMMSAHEWEEALHRLVAAALKKAPMGTRVFVLAIPQFGVNPHLPKPLASALDYHVAVMNHITEHETTKRAQAIYVPESRDQAYENEGPHEYQRWASRIADRISRNLDPSRVQAASTAPVDERRRLDALERAEALLEPRLDDPTLDRLADEAREVFGTAMAAVTFVDSESLHLRATSGFDHDSIPRAEAFCHMTIRRNAHFVVEDATLDGRYAQLPTVMGEPGVRFYAGYPIAAPTGERIGALCVMDSAPRSFSNAEAATLRDLALRVQEHLFVDVSAEGSR